MAHLPGDRAPLSLLRLRDDFGREHLAAGVAAGAVDAVADAVALVAGQPRSTIRRDRALLP
ncbi:hypothetical protein ACFW0I_24240 [[Kitasatospora] papulosa]|uniref:hypothetical protein n=1 Tax=[Kitasatospora] papulosa TaxID=1464011 RepID=UPI0036802A54